MLSEIGLPGPLLSVIILALCIPLILVYMVNSDKYSRKKSGILSRYSKFNKKYIKRLKAFF